jgi:hypothetical protein
MSHLILYLPFTTSIKEMERCDSFVLSRTPHEIYVYNMHNIIKKHLIISIAPVQSRGVSLVINKHFYWPLDCATTFVVCNRVLQVCLYLTSVGGQAPNNSYGRAAISPGRPTRPVAAACSQHPLFCITRGRGFDDSELLNAPYIEPLQITSRLFS